MFGTEPYVVFCIFFKDVLNKESVALKRADCVLFNVYLQVRGFVSEKLSLLWFHIEWKVF